MSIQASETEPVMRIDPVAHRFWIGSENVLLRPKTWDVLVCLASRPGVLITKNELLDLVWPDSVVSEGTLNKSIGELRTVLGEDRASPRCIETVSRRGFRWIGPADIVRSGAFAPEPAGAQHVAPPVAAPGAASGATARLVGRDAELEALERQLGVAAAGTRQVVFVTGEAGAGKSTLVDAFLATLEETTGAALVAHGQCIEAFGRHEPYRPILEAVERLAGHPVHGDAVQATLRRHAPTWLRRMSALGEGEANEAAADAPARMLREIAGALEALSREWPLVLVIEDVHWADLETADACSMLARRRDPSRLMLILTMRPADALVAQHPLLQAKSDLASRGLAREIALAAFTPASVQEYLSERCVGLGADLALPELIHYQSGGNPLFVRIVVDDLIARGALATNADGDWELTQAPEKLSALIPDSLRELVESQLERLADDERSVVEAASVHAVEFAASSVAAAAGLSEEEAEAACMRLARRRHILRGVSHAGPGSRSRAGHFSFVHSVVQRLLHDQIPAARVRRLHLAAAERLEREPSGSDSVAVQVALHYAMAGDPAAALAQLQRVAASIQRIPAPREVIVIRERILDLIESNPELPDFRRERLRAMMELSQARQLQYGAVDEETGRLCEEALPLAVPGEDDRELFLAKFGIFWSRYYVGRYADALKEVRELLVMATRSGLSVMIQSVEFSHGSICYRMGDFAEASLHFESCLANAAAAQNTFGWNFPSMSMSHLALIAAHSGRPSEARRLIREADGLGDDASQPRHASVIPLLAHATAVLGDDDDATRFAERSLALADRTGSAAWLERARFLSGLMRSRSGRVEEGVRLMKESLARQARGHVLLDRTAYCSLLAEELMRRDLPGADAVLEDGLEYMARAGEEHFQSELYRLRGHLRAGRGDAAGAESDFREGLRSARERGAHGNELRSAIPLAELLDRGGRVGEARSLLDGTCASFAGDADLPDLAGARTLLSRLGGG